MPRIANLLRTAAEWTSGNPVLGAGQIGVEKLTNKKKIGNGVTAWNSLRYVNQSPEPKVVELGALGATETLPEGSLITGTLDANCTLTFPEASLGKTFELVLTQDATGSRLVTWPVSVKWPASTAPTLTTTATKRDRLRFVCHDGTNWLGLAIGQNYA